MDPLLYLFRVVDEKNCVLPRVGIAISCIYEAENEDGSHLVLTPRDCCSANEVVEVISRLEEDIARIKKEVQGDRWRIPETKSKQPKARIRAIGKT